MRLLQTGRRRCLAVIEMNCLKAGLAERRGRKGVAEIAEGVGGDIERFSHRAVLRLSLQPFGSH